MKDLFNKAMSWLLASMDASNNGGASARKLSAAWIMVVLVTPTQFYWLHSACVHDKWDELFTVLTLDFGFAATALGMTTYQNIKSMKNKAEDTTTTTDPSAPIQDPTQAK